VGPSTLAAWIRIGARCRKDGRQLPSCACASFDPAGLRRCTNKDLLDRRSHGRNQFLRVRGDRHRHTDDRPGEQLPFVISSRNLLGTMMPAIREYVGANSGMHVIHTGGERAPYLQLPVQTR
jgi:hypothetical protein